MRREFGVFARIAPVVAATLVVGACSPTPPDPAPSSEPSATASPTPTREELLRDHAPGLKEEVQDFSLDELDVPAAKGSAVSVTVGDRTSYRWRTTNLGLSFEAETLADPRWEPGSSSLDLLIGSLDEPSLRFGGNSVDRRVWWTSSDETPPTWAETTVTPDDLARVGRFLDATDATVTLVLPLGHKDPERAADMAAHAHEQWGDRLVAVAFGNEPNGYHHPSQPELEMRDASYDEQAWVKEARAYQKAVEERVPEMAVMGPGAYDRTWWRAFGDADLDHKKGLTQHWYPLWSCEDRTTGTDPDFEPTIEDMTSRTVHDKATNIFTSAHETAASYDLPLFVDETGPTSCPGTNETSRTLAQTLWTVDYTLNGARNGVVRMNMHSALDPCRGGPPMSVTCDREKKASSDIKGQSNYLALLFANQASEGRFRSTKVSGDDKVFAYAIDHEDGVDVVVINMNAPGESRPLEISGVSGEVRASLLTGPDLAERKATLVPRSPASDIPDRIPGGSALMLRFPTD